MPTKKNIIRVCLAVSGLCLAVVLLSSQAFGKNQAAFPTDWNEQFGQALMKKVNDSYYHLPQPAAFKAVYTVTRDAAELGKLTVTFDSKTRKVSTKLHVAEENQAKANDVAELARRAWSESPLVSRFPGEKVTGRCEAKGFVRQRGPRIFEVPRGTFIVAAGNVTPPGFWRGFMCVSADYLLIRRRLEYRDNSRCGSGELRIYRGQNIKGTNYLKSFTVQRWGDGTDWTDTVDYTHARRQGLTVITQMRLTRTSGRKIGGKIIKKQWLLTLKTVDVTGRGRRNEAAAKTKRTSSWTVQPKGG